MMNGGEIKKAVIEKGKQMASVASAAANGNGGKKRRKGTDLKPIVTNESTSLADSSTGSTSSQGYVL
jgi:serine/threonine-protein kinase SRPK3